MGTAAAANTKLAFRLFDKRSSSRYGGRASATVIQLHALDHCGSVCRMATLQNTTAKADRLFIARENTYSHPFHHIKIVSILVVIFCIPRQSIVFLIIGLI